MKDISKILTSHNPDRYKSTFMALTCLILCIIPLYSLGQEIPKKALTKKDYGLWSRLLSRKISDKGNWTSFLLMYEPKKDTLFVKSSTGSQTYNFPDASDGEFNEESEFASIARDTLWMISLKNGSLTKIAGVNEFSFSGSKKLLFFLQKQSEGKQHLVVQDLKGNKKLEISNVIQWRLEPNRNGVIYVRDSDKGNEIGYINLVSEITKHSILIASEAKFQNINWKGNTIAFIQINTGFTLLYSYNIKTNKLNCFDYQKHTDFPQDMKVSEDAYQILTISDKEDRIFFWIKEEIIQRPENDLKAVQIWNTADKQLFEQKKFIGKFALADKMAVWFLDSGCFTQITNKELPRGYLSADYEKAFIYDPLAYEPQSSFDSPFDLYIVDLRTQKKKQILEKYSGDNFTIPSPDGKYLAYADEGNWWIYDVNTDKHSNVTASIPYSFFRQDQDKPIAANPHGTAGWVKGNDNAIILYDQYDLWLVSADGTVKKKLTRGREIGRTYRIKKLAPEPLYQQDQFDSKTAPIELNKNLILQAVDKYTGISGFYKWTLKTGEQKLVWKEKKVNQLLKAKDCDKYSYTEQSYEVSPALMLFDKSSTKIFQSNNQQQHFHWGKSEAIHFSSAGKNLSGILYYPAQYQQGRSYPMIVHIYERQFQYFNDYQNPSIFSSDGFNITNLTLQGYFVLLPDMVFEKGNLVQSASTCVLAAIDAACSKESIDSTKIGLIGHSFGGYLTDLIITQTNRFAAAVSGAAWTDLVSSYLYVGRTFSRPDYYRAEYDQLRIGKSLYENMEGYLKNSPVLMADNVATPLLGWTGEEDRHIHYLQSMEFYMALRRLNKKHTLLVYPEEEHNLSKYKNREDLSLRIEQWFGHYLKNEPVHAWMKSDFQ